MLGDVLSWREFYRYIAMRMNKFDQDTVPWEEKEAKDKTLGSPTSPVLGLVETTVVFSSVVFEGKTFLTNMKWLLKWSIGLPWNCALSI